MSSSDPHQPPFGDPRRDLPQAPEAAAAEPPEPRLLLRRQPEEAPAPSTPAARTSAAVADAPASPARAARPPRRKGLRRTLRLLPALLVALLLLVGAAYLLVRHSIRSAAVRSLPQVEGRLAVSGLAGPVTVERDARGVPSIRANLLDDLVFAQGYVTAGERLFQMDLMRRHAAGTLAEVLGPALVEHDSLARTLLLPPAADRALAVLPADQLHLLTSYSQGVNAAVAHAQSDGALPAEFAALHYTPEPWTPRDSLLVAMAMFEDLTNSFPTKLAREALTARLPPELAADLYPVGSWRDHPPADPLPDLTVPGPPFEQVPLDESQSSLTPPTLAAPALPCLECVAGSNNWVVSGAHTASGKPLLANDMHLNHSMPGVWYEAGLEAPLPGAAEPLHVAGVTLPGLPLVVVGHNEHIAWGFTVLGADVQDVYIEDTRGTGAAQQFRSAGGGWQPVVHRTEHIRVRGARDLDLDVAATQHGGTLTPILNPILTPATVAPGGKPRTLALRWVLYDPHALTLPMLQFATAHDWPSFKAALAGFGGPAQNVVYADDAGHIGYHAAGLIPLRGPAGTDASPAALPADLKAAGEQDPYSTGLPQTASPLGATSIALPSTPRTPQRSGPLSAVPLVPSPAHEWSGYIPFDALPEVYDPPGGLIATANARTAPDDFPYPITLNWAAPYRADRIYHALAHRTGLTAASMLALENDVYSDFDHVLAERLAYAIDHAHLAGEDATRLAEAANLLRSFDGRMSTDSAAAAIVYSTHAALWPMLLEPHLAKGTEVNDLYLWGERDYALEQLLSHTPARWLHKPYTTWDDLLAAAVLRGLKSAHAPTKLAAWHYGELQTVSLIHPIFGRFPLLAGMLGYRTGTGAVPQSGDATTVKQVGHTFGPSERFVADLGAFDGSSLNLPAGESGNPASDHYLDQFSAWLHGTSFPLPFSREAVDRAAVHTLTLEPGR